MFGRNFNSSFLLLFSSLFAAESVSWLWPGTDSSTSPSPTSTSTGALNNHVPAIPFEVIPASPPGAMALDLDPAYEAPVVQASTASPSTTTTTTTTTSTSTSTSTTTTENSSLLSSTTEKPSVTTEPTASPTTTIKATTTTMLSNVDATSSGTEMTVSNETLRDSTISINSTNIGRRESNTTNPQEEIVTTTSTRFSTMIPTTTLIPKHFPAYEETTSNPKTGRSIVTTDDSFRDSNGASDGIDGNNSSLPSQNSSIAPDQTTLFPTYASGFETSFPNVSMVPNGLDLTSTTEPEMGSSGRNDSGRKVVSKDTRAIDDEVEYISGRQPSDKGPESGDEGDSVTLSTSSTMANVNITNVPINETTTSEIKFGSVISGGLSNSHLSIFTSLFLFTATVVLC